MPLRPRSLFEEPRLAHVPLPASRPYPHPEDLLCLARSQGSVPQPQILAALRRAVSGRLLGSAQHSTAALRARASARFPLGSLPPPLPPPNPLPACKRSSPTSPPQPTTAHLPTHAACLLPQLRPLLHGQLHHGLPRCVGGRGCLDAVGDAAEGGPAAACAALEGLRAEQMRAPSFRPCLAACCSRAPCAASLSALAEVEMLRSSQLPFSSFWVPRAARPPFPPPWCHPCLRRCQGKQDTAGRLRLHHRHRLERAGGEQPGGPNVHTVKGG